MKHKTMTLFLICAIAALILDSRCAADSARAALELCTATLIPSLFPLFVLTGMLLPGLKSLRIPGLARLLGFPAGSEGIFLLGCAGGFPVGAACTAQGVENGTISKGDASRMLGLCSLCGPSFLFGVLAQVLSPAEAVSIFVIQLETALLLAAFWPGRSTSRCSQTAEAVSLPAAVRRAIGSMATVCAWVMLAGVAAGFLRRWLFPLLPGTLGVLLTGLLELTNGIFSLDAVADPDMRFLLCTVFVCFGGVSVLLQIAALAAPAGIPMGQCILQKALHALLAAIAAYTYLRVGASALFLPLLPLAAKIAVEIPAGMVYNVRRKEGI